MVQHGNSPGSHWHPQCGCEEEEEAEEEEAEEEEE